MLHGWWLWVIVIWSVFMVIFMAIGGFFMFRKFLKKLPKNGGKSDFDVEVENVDLTRHLWNQSEKDLLEDLISPVPSLFRDVARMKIAGKIGELAQREKVTSISEVLVIRGYILATPQPDHQFLRKKLREKNIEITEYQDYF